MDKKKRKLSSTTPEDDECDSSRDQAKTKQYKADEPPKIVSKAAYFVHSTQDVIDTVSALAYLCDEFPSDRFPDLPKQIYKHQLYSLVQNKTSVDREIDSLRKDHKIVLFKCDSKTYSENDVVICFYADFKLYVDKLLSTSSTISAPAPVIRKSLISLFIDKILIEESSPLSMSKLVLVSKYGLSDKDITCLIQFGVLSIKDAAHFWLAMPNVGPFRRGVLEARKLVVDTLKKKKYKEIEFDELDKRNAKNKLHQVGIVYVLHDLLGSETIRRVEVPNKSVFFKLI